MCGIELRRFRLVNGLTQEEMADALACDRSVISRAERGSQELPTRRYETAGNFGNPSPAELFEELTALGPTQLAEWREDRRGRRGPYRLLED